MIPVGHFGDPSTGIDTPHSLHPLLPPHPPPPPLRARCPRRMGRGGTCSGIRWMYRIQPLNDGKISDGYSARKLIWHPSTYHPAWLNPSNPSATPSITPTQSASFPRPPPMPRPRTPWRKPPMLLLLMMLMMMLMLLLMLLLKMMMRKLLQSHYRRRRRRRSPRTLRRIMPILSSCPSSTSSSASPTTPSAVEISRT